MTTGIMVEIHLFNTTSHRYYQSISAVQFANLPASFCCSEVVNLSDLPGDAHEVSLLNSVRKKTNTRFYFGVRGAFG